MILVFIDLTEPHIHKSVPGLADLSHVQLPRPWCHQSWGHASWVRSVQTSQLVERRNNDKEEERYSPKKNFVPG